MALLSIKKDSFEKIMEDLRYDPEIPVLEIYLTSILVYLFIQ